MDRKYMTYITFLQPTHSLHKRKIILECYTMILILDYEYFRIYETH